MSLLAIEGFESFGTGIPSGIDRKYFTAGEGSMALVTGRTGGLGLELGSTGESFFPLTPGNPPTSIIGFGFKTSNLTNENLVFFRADGNNNIVLKLNSDGSLSILRATTVLATTSAGLISVDTWYYIEIKAKINNTTGEYELRVNETTELSDTNVDTQDGTNAWTEQFLIRGHNFGNTVYDDLYILDDAGSKNNTFLNTSVIRAMYPNAAGDASDFTPDSGSNHERVKENPTDDNTSYVESSTTGHQDLHNHDNISPTGVIRGIQISTEVRDTVAGGSSLKTLIKSGATLNTGPADIIAGTTFEYFTRILEEDPNISDDWVTSAIDAAQIGYEVG